MVSNISYEVKVNQSPDDWLNDVSYLCQGILSETVEYFGEEMPDSPSSNVPLTESILKFAEENETALFSSNGRWASAVVTMAQWYVDNIHSYSQQTHIFCPLIKKNVRCDCSGFVTACLQLYGALNAYDNIPASKDYVSNHKLGEDLSSAGFTKIVFSWDAAKPFDIICRDNHVEIYNGVIDGRKTSYAWGKWHASLPCDTAYSRSGYDYIWRCYKSGHLEYAKGLWGDKFNVDLNNINTMSKSGVAKAVYKKLQSIGCSHQSILGILANMMEESSLDPTVVTWDGSVVTKTFGVGGGLCGFYFNGALRDLAKHAWGVIWKSKLFVYNKYVALSGLPYPYTPGHPANSKHIRSKFGGFPFTLEQQLNYLSEIINKSYSSIKIISDPGEAAIYWERFYERPAKITDRWAKHGKTIISLLKS